MKTAPFSGKHEAEEIWERYLFHSLEAAELEFMGRKRPEVNGRTHRLHASLALTPAAEVSQVS